LCYTTYILNHTLVSTPTRFGFYWCNLQGFHSNFFWDPSQHTRHIQGEGATQKLPDCTQFGTVHGGHEHTPAVTAKDAIASTVLIYSISDSKWRYLY